MARRDHSHDDPRRYQSRTDGYERTDHAVLNALDFV